MTRHILLLLFLLVGFNAFLAFDAHAQNEHRIAIRTAEGRAEFYDRTTGKTFVPRGNNYIELRADPTNSFLISSLFFPTYHDAADIAFDFERMQALGYNTARIFIDQCKDVNCIADVAGGLRDDYMDNIVELLHLARRHEIFVLLTANWLPDVGGYLDAHVTCPPTFDAGNCLLMSSEGVASYRRYFQDFVQGLLDRQAPLDIILGFQLRNEAFFENFLPPLSWSSGQVTTANGQTYDMALPEDKARMAEEGLIHWANETRAAIRALDPTALVTAGFFAPNFPHEWRPGARRLVLTRGVLRDSDLDFLDFHLYSDAGLTMTQQVENFGMVGYEAKPIILGEMGAFRNQYASPATAAQPLQTWQAEACAAGFDGFLLWYWDPINSPLVGDNVWGPHDGTGEIARALAPVFHSDPCEDDIIPNLAAGKPTSASTSLPSAPPEQATDGNLEQGWGAGSGPVQWIEIDLLQPTTIGRIALRVDQFPAGPTVHQIQGRAIEQDPYELLHEFSGSTQHGEWLEATPTTPWESIRWVRVLTTQSPSWVAWMEIEIYPPETRLALPLPPSQQAPAHLAEGLSTMQTLEWNAVSDADTYEVQVSTESDFNSLVFERSDLTVTDVAIGPLPDDAGYYWRVRAQNADGDSPWSAVRHFTVGTATTVAPGSSDIPNSFASYPGYPNPFRSGTTLRFDLPEPTPVSLVVYDVLGRKVITLVSKTMPAGQHRVQWRPEGTPSGLYFYRLTAGDVSHTGRLLLVR